jgi:membrane protease YdiL (CAAX protease family)
MTDGPVNPIPHRQISPSLQFLILFGLLISLILIGAEIGKIIIESSFGAGAFKSVINSDGSSQQARNALWIFQLISTTLPILLCPVFFSYIIVREPDNYLKTTFEFPWLLIVIVFLVMILSSPVMEFISNINENLNLPKWMRDEEDALKKVSDNMLQMKTIGSMFFNLVFIGLVTAIAEELLFRGALQTILMRWTKNKHAAVWITAILFSAFHMEFFGFIPRLMLGVLFGYFVAWSGSIWPAIWGHFVNNGTVVVITYLAQKKIWNIDLDDQHMFNITMYIVSFIITIFLLFIYRYIAVRRQISDINGEELG